MKKFALIALFVATVTLSACDQKENPLAVTDLEQLTSWLYKKRTPPLVACARLWADRPAAPEKDLKVCELVASEWADLLKKGGFGEVTAEDVQWPVIWTAFNEKMKTEKDTQTGVEQLNDAFKLPYPIEKKN